MISIYFTLLGLAIGSFINVLVMRHGSRSLSGRSFCDSCGYTLHWYNLVPVFSYVFQRGRCSECRAKLSIQYPLVEISCAALFYFVSIAHVTLLQQIILLGLVVFALAISVYDIRHTIIPDAWVYSFIILSGIFGVLEFIPSSTEQWLLYAMSGPAAALPLFALWAVSKGAWMGFGDVKLALGMGWLLGLYWGVVAVFGGFIIGAIISLTILLPLPYIKKALSLHRSKLGEWQQSFTMSSEVSFGPFLICSCFLVLYTQYILAVPLPALW